MKIDICGIITSQQTIKEIGNNCGRRLGIGVKKTEISIHIDRFIIKCLEILNELQIGIGFKKRYCFPVIRLHLIAIVLILQDFDMGGRIRCVLNHLAILNFGFDSNFSHYLDRNVCCVLIKYIS